jgi:hypothetical protein
MTSDPDGLRRAVLANTARDKDTAKLLQEAIEIIEQLRMKLDGQREELRVSRDLIERQQRLLVAKGIIP